MKDILRIIYVGLFPVLFLVFFTGCKKGNNASTYYLKYKVNGEQVTYNSLYSQTVSFDTSGPQFSCEIIGFNNNSNINITIYDTVPVTSGTYSGFATGSSSFYDIWFYYEDGNGNLTACSSSTANHNVSIAITATAITGTFNGVISAAGKPDITITDGQFVIQK